MDVLAVMADCGHAVLNLNVPQLPIQELKGVKAATLAEITTFFSQVEDRTDKVLKIGYQRRDEELPADSDSALVKAGYAAISSLDGISAFDCSDVVDRLNSAAA